MKRHDTRTRFSKDSRIFPAGHIDVFDVLSVVSAALDAREALGTTNRKRFASIDKIDSNKAILPDLPGVSAALYSSTPRERFLIVVWTWAACNQAQRALLAVDPQHSPWESS